MDGEPLTITNNYITEVSWKSVSKITLSKKKSTRTV